VGAGSLAIGAASVGQSTSTVTNTNFNAYYYHKGWWYGDWGASSTQTTSGLTALFAGGPGSLGMLAAAGESMGVSFLSYAAISGVMAVLTDVEKRKKCSVSCGLSENVRLLSEKDESVRIALNTKIAEISGKHFKNSVDHLKIQVGSNSNSDLSLDFSKNGEDIDYITALFSTGTNEKLSIPLKIGEMCLRHCPVDVSSEFILKVIEVLNEEDVLRLGQMLSYHDNLISFDSVKNTHLARFLKDKTLDSKVAAEEKINILKKLQLFIEDHTQKHDAKKEKPNG
jgi:hypothetical protein